MMGLSDQCTIYYCQCGHFAYKNAKNNTYHCSKCIKSTEIRKTEVPYPWKLMNQELIAMGIMPLMQIGDKD